MSIRDNEVSVSVRYIIIICRILYRSNYDEIERKTGVQVRIAYKIVKRIMERVDNDDFYDILTCVELIDKFERS